MPLQPPPTPTSATFVPLSLSSALARPHTPRANVLSSPTSTTGTATATAGRTGRGGGIQGGGTGVREAAGRLDGVTGRAAAEEVDLVPSSSDALDPDSLLRSQALELASLRSELLAVKKERDALQYEVRRGIGAEELDRLERSFAGQEELMAGYQRDAEMSFKVIEALKVKQRRLTEELQKIYGSSYVLSDVPSLSPSPSLRAFSRRPSVLPTRLAGFTSPETDGVVEDDRGEWTEEGARSHARMVRELLRGMEERLGARRGELEGMEERAREEGRRAEELLGRLEGLTVGVTG